MASSTIAGFIAFLKNYFNPQKVEDLTRAGKPFFSRIKTNEDVSGDIWTVPILVGNPQGVSAGTLANAQTGQSAVAGIKWLINMGNYFGSTLIGDKVIMASRNNMGAFLENKKTEIEGLYESFANDLAIQLWRNGGGAIGQIQQISTNTITLTKPQDVFNFEVNEFVMACADDGTNTGTTPRTGSTFVTGVDRKNGTVTLNSAAGITSLGVGDFLFRLGNAVANTSTLLLHGVQAYITASDSPGALWGVTRSTSTDIQRLTGCKMPIADVNGKGIEERIQLLGAYMQGRYRAMTSGGNYEAWLHPEDWHKLNLSCQNRGERSLTEDETKFGFEYINVIAGGKRIKTFSDPYMPQGSGFILRMDNFVLGSYGPLISPVNIDGLTLLRQGTTNDYEYRLKSYPEMSCNAPGFSGFFPIA